MAASVALWSWICWQVTPRPISCDGRRSSSLMAYLGVVRARRQKVVFSGSCLLRRFSTSDEDRDTRVTDVNYNKLPRLYIGLPTDAPATVFSLKELGEQVHPVQQQAMLSQDTLISLSPNQSHYVTSVLRLMKSKDRRRAGGRPPLVRVFDGSGEEWLTELLPLPGDDDGSGKKRRRDNAITAVCRSKIRSSSTKRDEQQDTSNSCWLCVAPPKKKDRLKWLLEKTTELGCSGYMWLDTDFSEDTTYKSSSSKSSKTVVPYTKLQSYAIEASEQCERLTLPVFVRITSSSDQTASAEKNKSNAIRMQEQSSKDQCDATTKLLDFLQMWDRDDDGNNKKLLICRERSNNLRVWQALQQTDSATTTAFLIGPEGGWSPKEEMMMDELQRDHPDRIFNVSLGPTVLRAETAAMTAMAAFTLYQDHLLNKD